jgi:hypothetical protein
VTTAESSRTTVRPPGAGVLSLKNEASKKAEAQVGRNDHRDERRREQTNSLVLVDHPADHVCAQHLAVTPTSAPDAGLRAHAATSSPFRATSPIGPKWTRR